MLLAIDVGNTDTVFALCDHKPEHVWRLSTDHKRTADEYAAALLFLMEHSGISPRVVKASIIASVVPDTVFALRRFCQNYLACTPLVLGRDIKPTAMPIDIDKPDELGADRLVNALTAWETHKQALIVVDFGTATTFDVVDARGHYIGGAIAPGVNLSLDALAAAAAKLHGVSITKPKDGVIGKHTTGAMQSGIYYGYIGLIDGIVGRIKQELGGPVKVIATGGLASLYAQDNPTIDVLDTDLTVRGLQLIYQQHLQA